jgi:hypothetical protein
MHPPAGASSDVAEKTIMDSFKKHQSLAENQMAKEKKEESAPLLTVTGVMLETLGHDPFSLVTLACPGRKEEEES